MSRISDETCFRSIIRREQIMSHLLIISVYILTLSFVSAEKQHGLDNVWISKIFSDTMWNFSVNTSTNSECNQQGLTYLQHLQNNTHWAIRMLDSSLVSPSGLISGDNTQFGHPDQCVQTQIPIQSFYPKYCLPVAHFSPHTELYPEYENHLSSDWPVYDMEKNVWDFIRPRDESTRHARHSFSWGLCVPEICTAPEVQASLNETLFQAFAKHQIRFEVNLTDINCYSASEVENRQLPIAGQRFVIVLIVLVFLSILGTTVDYRRSYCKDTSCSGDSKPEPITSFLLNFSWIAHTKSLFSSAGIRFIDGIKGMTIIFTIMNHRVWIGFSFAGNMEFVERARHNVNYAWLMASGNILDAFFVISGFLLAWAIIKKINKSGNTSINYGTIILKRVLRMYPMYIAVICFVIWVLPYLGEGPLWKSFLDTQSKTCRQNWWLNLLFINSLVDSTPLCMIPSWYLSTDFQLFLISLALIYLASNHPSCRASILLTALILAYATPSIVIYFTREVSFWIYSISEMRNLDWATDNYYRRVYPKFYMRAPPYILGVCSAYLADYLAKRKIQMRESVVVVLFFLFFYLTFFMFHVGFLLYLPGHVYNVWEHVVYAALNRLVWPVYLAIFLILEVTGQLKFTSAVFSSTILVVIGRLSYHIYLLNLTLIYMPMYIGQTSSYISKYTVISQGFADVAMVTLLAYVTSMLLEYPMDILRRFIV